MTEFPAVRQVEEWVGATPDTPVPDRVKLRVFEREKGRCYLSGRTIRPGDKWDVEHVIAIVNGGENRERNLRIALNSAHAPKTAADVRTKAKIARVKAKHLGLGSKRRGFCGWRRFDGTIVRKESTRD